MSRFEDAKIEIKKLSSSVSGPEFLEKTYRSLVSNCKYTAFGIFDGSGRKTVYGNLGKDAEKALEMAMDTGNISTSGKAISAPLGSNGSTIYIAAESFLPFFDDIDKGLVEFLRQTLREKGREIFSN